MSIQNFSISQTQWHVLAVFKHPVCAAGILQAKHEPFLNSLRYVNMDVNFEYLNLRNAMVGVGIL